MGITSSPRRRPLISPRLRSPPPRRAPSSRSTSCRSGRPALLPRNPGDIIFAPSVGGTVTGPSYDDQSYLLAKPADRAVGSTLLDGADQRHEQSVAANAALMATLREAARLHGAPLVDAAARLEAQAVAEDAAIMQGLRESARLHGAPISDPLALRQAQAVSIEAQINAGLREAAKSTAS